MRRRVTFSRNLTLSLSRTCRCYCKYCAFATHKPHLYAPDEVERLLDRATRLNVKELLILTGEKPEVNRVVAERLRGYGHEDFTPSARSSAGCCPTRTSACSSSTTSSG
jgi:FO synthase